MATGWATVYIYIFIYGFFPTHKHSFQGSGQPPGALSFASCLASTRWTQASVVLSDGDGGGGSTVGDDRTAISTITLLKSK